MQYFGFGGDGTSKNGKKNSDRRGGKNNKNNRKTLLITAIMVGFFILTSLFGGAGGNSMMIKLSDFMFSAQEGRIEKANVMNETVIGTMKDGTKFKTYFPEIYIARVLDTLTQSKVDYEFLAIDGQKTLFDRIFSAIFHLLSWLPMILLTLWIAWPFIQMRKNKGIDPKLIDNESLDDALSLDPNSYH